MLTDDVLVFDNLASKIHIVTHIDVDVAQSEAELQQRYAQGQQRLIAIAQELQHAHPILDQLATTANDGVAAGALQESDFSSGFTQADYHVVVEKIKDYTLAGDVMQVVPSQRMSAPFSAPPINLYRALRSLNPSPYMYFLDLGDFHIVGSSPEILARVEGGEVTVRPIAGTRRRGSSEAEDLALERDLLADPKEIAEHLMLIDLGRNDAGRVAEIGSVVLTDKMVVERYSHVMHIVSNVIGKLRSGLSSIDVLRATLPAGTLSGAPKIRAMEIIDELETTKRKIYSGGIGYFSANGEFDTCIALRTAVVKNKKFYVQAGAGIVADSNPIKEYEETVNKAKALMHSLKLWLY